MVSSLRLPRHTLWGRGCGYRELLRVGNVGACVYRNKPLCAVTLKDTGRGSHPLDWQHHSPPLKNDLQGHIFFCSHRHLKGLRDCIKVTWLFIPLCVVF